MRAAREFRVDVRRDGTAVVVAPSGQLDLASVIPLREALRQQVGCAVIVLDLRELSFMDSAGLHLILEEHRRAERVGVELRLVRAPERVQRLFELTGVSRHLLWVDEVPAPAQDGGSVRS